MKKASKRNAEGLLVMRFADLMDHLGTLTRNTMRVSLHGAHRFTHANPGGCLSAARSRTLACPVEEKPSSALRVGRQRVVGLQSKNFGLEGDPAIILAGMSAPGGRDSRPR
jgi:hypothetical protein